MHDLYILLDRVGCIVQFVSTGTLLYWHRLLHIYTFILQAGNPWPRHTHLTSTTSWHERSELLYDRTKKKILGQNEAKCPDMTRAKQRSDLREAKCFLLQMLLVSVVFIHDKRGIKA